MGSGQRLGQWMAGLMAAGTASLAGQVDALSTSEMIFERAPHAECHASTLVVLDQGPVAAWFGGTREKHPDVGIWLSRRDRQGWSRPREVANGVVAPGERHPTWNPVLFRPAGGPLLLFYKVGPSPREWWGMTIASTDGGETWGAPRRLPDGILGPIKNKPMELADGTLLAGSSTEHDGWRVHFEWTTDQGVTWERTPPLEDGGQAIGAIQPTLLRHPGGRLQALCRSRQGRIAQAWSEDGGRTWGRLTLLDLPNPNSGIDAVTLADGRHLLVYNPSTLPAGRWGGSRAQLDVALSDDGLHWRSVLELEEHDEGEYSYPAVVQGPDGRVHVTYTYDRRKIKYVVLDPEVLDPVRHDPSPSDRR